MVEEVPEEHEGTGRQRKPTLEVSDEGLAGRTTLLTHKSVENVGARLRTGARG